MIKIFQKFNQISETRSRSHLKEKLFVFCNHSERYDLLNNSNKEADHGGNLQSEQKAFQVSWEISVGKHM